MSGWEDDLVDPFLAELGEGDVPSLVDALASEAKAPPSLRGELLAKLTHTGRFDRFIERVSELLDVDDRHAKSMLDAIHEEGSWHTGQLPGVHLYDVDGGPKVENAITGFVRMAQGTPFPDHEHMGQETALIVQGSAIDSRGELWRVGDVVVMEPGTDHAFEARPGPDLLFLVIVQRGLKVGGVEFGPSTNDL